MAQPRVLLFPFPAPGHVKPFLTLAELLSDAGLDVVFLNTEYNHRRIANIDALAWRFPSLHFETIADGLTPDQSRSTVDGPLYFSLLNGNKPRFRQLIQCFNDASSTNNHRRPITCIINDVLLSSPIEVAEEFGIPVITFCPYSAAYLSSHFFIPKLLREAQIPYTDENAMGEMKGVPEFKGHLRRNHLPGFWDSQSSDISFSHDFIAQTLAIDRTSALIINTFHELESPFLTHLSSIFKQIYTIGPLHALSKSRLGNSSSSSPSALSKFWKQDTTKSSVSWLDAQPRKSVIFVSFGTTIQLKPPELTELWHGLINSGKRFLWVMRSGESSDLIERLAAETGENGMVVEWVSQEEVLGHGSVGGFLTHCGWNSTVESIVAGVPLICWPIRGDQFMNATWIDRVLGIGIERDEKWDRFTVEKMVEELMDAQKGMDVRRSMEKLSQLANEKVVEVGSSFHNLEVLVQDIQKLKPKNSKKNNDQ